MKQVTVTRTDLNMRKGKMIVQGQHGVVGIVSNYLVFAILGKDHSFLKRWDAWLEAGQRKISVRTDSEESIRRFATMAKEMNIPFYVVTDAGHTEFNGVPTVTCITLGPDTDERIDQITGELKPL